MARPRSWPGVIFQDGEGVTVSTDSRTLVPQLIVRHVARIPGRTADLAHAWGTIEPGVSALHRLLGGEPELVDNVVTAALHPDTRRALTRSSDDLAFGSAYSALCRSIDESEHFGHFANWLDGAISGVPVVALELDEYGAWGRRVLCWWQILNFAARGPSRPSADWQTRMIEEHAGIDSGLPVRPTWFVEPGGASTETALLEAAMVIAQNSPPEDPVTAAIARAMCAERTEYRGLAHAEAVVVLDERGEPERAWGVLQAASWWAWHSLGQVPEVLLHGARLLAQRHGWSDVLTLLDQANRG